jgi:CheY-like chemotaxis protein
LAEVLAARPPAKDIRFVADGVELMDYLGRRGSYERPADSPRPCLLILDLKMPRKSGWEALQEIAGDPTLEPIPIVVLSTSNAQRDISRCYDLGASRYITKPAAFEDWLAAVTTLERYWVRL